MIKVQPETFFCPVCSNEDVFEPFGVNTRENAKCPHCFSLERHRFLYLVYNFLFLNVPVNKKILHFAPERYFADIFSKNTYIDYTAADLYPEKYGHIPNCLKLDAQNIALDDGIFDIVLANHMMEHLEDDKKFITEALRVLKPNGMLIFTVPVFQNMEKTYEDAAITSPQDRLKHFGLEDHYRIYGRDIIERFKDPAYTIQELNTSILPQSSIKKMALAGDSVYIVKKAS